MAQGRSRSPAVKESTPSLQQETGWMQFSMLDMLTLVITIKNPWKITIHKVQSALSFCIGTWVAIVSTGSGVLQTWDATNTLSSFLIRLNNHISKLDDAHVGTWTCSCLALCIGKWSGFVTQIVGAELVWTRPKIVLSCRALPPVCSLDQQTSQAQIFKEERFRFQKFC